MEERIAASDEVVPEIEWGSDPVFWSHLKLFVRDIFALPFYDDFLGSCWRFFRM